MKDIKIIIEKTSTGCSAYVEGIKKAGIYTTGKDIPDCLRNMAEAFELHHKKLKPHSPILVKKWEKRQKPSMKVKL